MEPQRGLQRRSHWADAGIREREHLQEWVISNPEIMGHDVLVVTMEFDRWISAGGSTQQDRLDILGLDRAGRLVVSELKRGRAPDTVQMQALNYAAMASRFSLDLLASAHAKYLERRGEVGVSPPDALARLQDWAPELSDDTLGSPRIIMLASDFPPSVTATAVFLHENGISIQLTRFQAYRTESEEILVTVSQLWPVPNAEDFTISPRSSARAERQILRERTRRANFLQRLVAAGEPKEGEELRIVVPGGVIRTSMQSNNGLREDSMRAQIRWRHDVREPAAWLQDGNSYSLLNLLREIIERATGEKPRVKVWVPIWFLASDRRTLIHIADAVSSSTEEGPERGDG